MKKLTVILICLVLSLLCSGVAYASWVEGGDVIFNAGTADLDVEIVKASAIYSSQGTNFTNDNIIIDGNGKTANVNIDGIYPGSITQFELIIKNTGSMPVSFDMIIQKFNYVIDTKTGNNLGTDSSLLKYIIISYDLDLLDKNGFSIQSLSNESASGTIEISKIYQDNTLIAVEPNQAVRIVMDIEMDSSAVNETMNKSFSFIISPLFVQN